MATIVNYKDILLQATSPRVPNNGVGDVEWGDVLDTAGTKPTNNADVTGSNTSNDTTNVNGIASTTITGNLTTVYDDYNAGNNGNYSAVTNPTVSSNAITSTVNNDGSIDATFSFVWGGTESTIDGFNIFFRGSTSSSTYTFGTSPSQEGTQFVAADKRSYVWRGIPADLYWTVGVQAYRRVTPKTGYLDGIILSNLVKATGAGENPFRAVSVPTITGANIDLTGSARFEGATSVLGDDYAVGINTSKGQPNGMFAYSGDALGIAIVGSALDGGNGVFGVAGTSSKAGVFGSSTHISGYAGFFYNSAGGTSLYCNGKMTKVGTELVTNLNANYVGGYDSAHLTCWMTTQSGTATAASNRLHITSSVTNVETSGSGFTITIYDITSDRTTKDNILPETLGLDFINALTTYTYTIKKDETKRIYHGLMAQDIEELLGIEPNTDTLLGRRADTGKLTLNYPSFITPTIKAVQELSDIVDTLTKRLDKQDKQIEKLLKAKK